MKRVMLSCVSFAIFFQCGCTTLKDYKTSHNQLLDNSSKNLNDPDTQEHIKDGYFSVVPNPYVTGKAIDSLGSSAFDSANCQIDKLNAQNATEDSKDSKELNKNHNNAICRDTATSTENGAGKK